MGVICCRGTVGIGRRAWGGRVPVAMSPGACVVFSPVLRSAKSLNRAVGHALPPLPPFLGGLASPSCALLVQSPAVFPTLSLLFVHSLLPSPPHVSCSVRVHRDRIVLSSCRQPSSRRISTRICPLPSVPFRFFLGFCHFKACRGALWSARAQPNATAQMMMRTLRKIRGTA